MQQLQKYDINFNEPISQPYDKDGIYNAYYMGINKNTNKKVLISQFKQKKFQRMVAKNKRLLKLKQIKHKNIAQIYEIILDKQSQKLFVILQWCQGGNLYDYQKSNGTMDIQLAVKLLHDLTQGLNQIHMKNQIHRYINMQNIQFDNKGQIKLTYRCLYPKTYYLSPEDKKGNRNKQSDIFSLGVLFYKIVLGQTPFKGNTLQQQIKNVQQGPKFPKDERKMFSFAVPVQIKSIIQGMTKFNSEQRYSTNYITRQCLKYFQNNNINLIKIPNLPNFILSKIFDKYNIPIFTKYTTQQQNIVLAIDSQNKQIIKFHIYRSKQRRKLSQYNQQILNKYKKNQKNILQQNIIIDSYIIDNQFLVIKSIYDNQGSLKNYIKQQGFISKKNIQILINQLILKLKGNPYYYLSDQSILIRKGNFYLNYPPFITKQFDKILKNSINQVDYYAPQVKQGKPGIKSDTWSISMLKYSLQYQQLPQFDHQGKLKIKKINPLDLNFYQNFLVKNNIIRKNIFDPQKDNMKQIKIPQGKMIIKQKTNKKYKLTESQSFFKKSFSQHLNQKFGFMDNLQKHWSKPLRIGFKCVFGLILIIYLFYWNYFIISGKLISEHSLYEQKIVKIRAFQYDNMPDINYTLVTKTPLQTYQFFFNKTLPVLRDQYKCVLNSYSVKSNVVQVISSPGFITFQIFGILIAIFNLFLFCFSLSKMDFPKIIYISKSSQNCFNQFMNWMFINMALASQISLFYLIYGSLFHLQLQPCLQKPTFKAVQFLFKKWFYSFNIRFIWIYIGIVFSYFVIFFFIIKPQYNLKNYLKVSLFVLYLGSIVCRIMAGVGESNSLQKQSVFGKAGQLIILILSFIYIVLDIVFAKLTTKQNKNNRKQQKKRNQKATHMKQIHQTSSSSLNNTQQEFFTY